VNVAHPDGIAGSQPLDPFPIIFFLVAQDEVGLQLINYIKAELFGTADGLPALGLSGRVAAKFGDADDFGVQSQIKEEFGLGRDEGDDTLGGAPGG